MLDKLGQFEAMGPSLSDQSASISDGRWMVKVIRKAPGRSNIKWCVSSFLWTSTQWPDKGALPYTEMLDVIRDTGFNVPGFTTTRRGSSSRLRTRLMLLKWTDPKKFHWRPDTVHLYMANCDIIGLFTKYAHRLIFFDLVDA